jgi:adenosylcobinamide-phosphate guanylyltransferase
MAGGRATRFGQPVEKGLLTVGGRTLLERSLNALDISEISRVLVAASPHTPRTRLKAEELEVEVVGTSGTGYHQDILELLEDHSQFLTLNVDIPFAQKEHVRSLLKAFDGGSLAAVLTIQSDGPRTSNESLARNDESGRTVWIGLNIVTPNPETMTIELGDPLLAININNEADLALADSIAHESGL